MNRTQSQDRHTGWPTRPLGDVVETEISTWNTGSHPDEEKQYIEIASIDAASKTIARTHLVQGRTAPSRARTIVHAGDVLVATTRPNLNAVAIVPQELDGQVCSTGFAVLRPTESMTSKWLYWSVRSPAFVRTVSDLVVGAMYPAVTDKQVRSVVIPVPPVLNQQCIVAKLDEQMAALDRAEKALAEQQAAASTFTTAALQQVFSGPDSKRWPLVKMGELCEVITDGVHQTPVYTADGIPFISTANLLPFQEDFDYSAYRRFVSVDAHELLAKRACPHKGDLLISKCGTIGLTQVVRVGYDFDIFVGLMLIRVRRNRVMPEFVEYLLNYPAVRLDLLGLASGSSRATLTIGVFTAFQIPLPSLPEQGRIVEMLDNRMAMIQPVRTALAYKQTTLAALRTSLLNAAFSGEI